MGTNPSSATSWTTDDVATIRGAGESAGRTSWTAKPELQDYSTLVGFMVHYSNHLAQTEDRNALVTIRSGADTLQGDDHAGLYPSHPSQPRSMELLLGGFSYGALILARLPPIGAVMKRFNRAEAGTAAADVLLRARNLAHKTRTTLQSVSSTSGWRGRQVDTDKGTRSRCAGVSPLVIGGEVHAAFVP